MGTIEIRQKSSEGWLPMKDFPRTWILAGLLVLPALAVSVSAQAASPTSQADLDMALRLMDQAVREAPKNSTLRAARAGLLLAMGLRAEAGDRRQQFCTRAAEDADEALRAEPNRPDLLLLRGRARKELGDPFRAIQDFSAVLTQDRIQALAAGDLHDPHIRLAPYWRAECYVNTQQEDRAIEDMNLYFRYAEPDRNSLFLRGVALHSSGRYPQALQDFNAILTADPDDVPALRQRALSYAGLRKPEQALADCDRAIRLEPDNARLYIVQAMAHLADDNRPAARLSAAQARDLGADIPAWLQQLLDGTLSK
jgi:tetratricopeptide (TPR) repeat protein